MKKSSEGLKLEKLTKLTNRRERAKLLKSLDDKFNLHKLVETELRKMKINDSPGPGQYSLPNSKSGPKFSLYGKLPEKLYTQTPGPGTYILPNDRVICAKISPPHSISFNNHWDKLGPGTYSPLTTFTSPKWGFGQSKRSTLTISESPGPGSYNIPSQASTRAFSMYPKISKPTSPSSPGPGSYEPKLLDKSLKFSLYPKIPPKLKFSTPGPGTYSPNLSVLKTLRR